MWGIIISWAINRETRSADYSSLFLKGLRVGSAVKEVRMIPINHPDILFPPFPTTDPPASPKSTFMRGKQE